MKNKKQTEILHHILIASHLLFMFYLSLSCKTDGRNWLRIIFLTFKTCKGSPFHPIFKQTVLLRRFNTIQSLRSSHPNS